MSFKQLVRRLGRALGAHRRLNDLPNLSPAGLDDLFQVLQCLARLRPPDAAFDKFRRFWIEAEAARDEDERRAHDGLAVRPKRLGVRLQTIVKSIARLDESCI